MQEEIRPFFNKDILNLYAAYLGKVEIMTDREREVYCDYFYHLTNPMMVAKNGINLERLHTL